MNNKTEIEALKQQLAEIQGTLAELEEAEECTPEYWEPTHGEYAWYIGSLSVDSSSIWRTETDVNLISRGLVFQTKQEAEDELALQQATYRLKKAIWKANGGKHRGFIKNEANYYISYRTAHKDLGFKIDYGSQAQPYWLYLGDEYKAIQLIKDHKDDLLTYFEITK